MSVIFIQLLLEHTEQVNKITGGIKQRLQN